VNAQRTAEFNGNKHWSPDEMEMLLKYITAAVAAKSSLKSHLRLKLLSCSFITIA